MKEFFEFCRKRIDLLIFNISIVAVVYGCRIFNLSVTMDTDLFINTPRSVYNWLDIGRYGLIFTEKIFGIRWYNPYINSTLGFFAIVAFLMMFAYSFEYISGRENRYNYFVFSALFMTHPIWVMQWVFKLQNFDIAISILLVAIAVYLTFSWIKCRAVWRLLLAIGCLVWSFGSYQANTTLFIAAVAFGILICKETDLKKLFLVCVKAVVPFGCAYILNSIIVKMFFSSGDYIEGQVLWGNVSAEQCIINIIQHIKQVFFVYKHYIYGYVKHMCCSYAGDSVQKCYKNSCLEMGGYFGVNNQPVYAYCVCGSSTCLSKSIYSSFCNCGGICVFNKKER